VLRKVKPKSAQRIGANRELDIATDASVRPWDPVQVDPHLVRLERVPVDPVLTQSRSPRGMMSEANKRAIEQAGLSVILGVRVADVPYVIASWRNSHPDHEIPDGRVFVQPWPAGPADRRRDHTIFYRYRADRARRTLWGIDQQITKAENA
jgi:hypothetical protein